jgi:hypothetical protein
MSPFFMLAAVQKSRKNYTIKSIMAQEAALDVTLSDIMGQDGTYFKKALTCMQISLY